jgi:hypothetical protein
VSRAERVGGVNEKVQEMKVGGRGKRRRRFFFKDFDFYSE